MNNKSLGLKIVSWTFGAIFAAIGVINTLWGNDPGFGIFILLLSSVYFLPVNGILRRKFGFSIPKMGVFKILLGSFIVWTSLGVGELFDKIDMMIKDLS